MSTKSKILEMFLAHSDKYLSGEEMAQRLNISRTAVWKAVNELKKDGHKIISSPKKGYQYYPTDVLTEAGIRYYLKEGIPDFQLIVEEQTRSTNQDLKQAAIENPAQALVKVVNDQTAGRGRFNRAYFAEAGKGVYFSLLLEPSPNLDNIALYTVIAATAVATAMGNYTDKAVEIKWVNDIYISGKKVCGILSEALTSMETNTISSVIVGIGINVTLTQTDLPKELQKKATSLFPDGKALCSRNQLVADILNEFYAILAQLPEKNFLEEYRRRSFVLGKDVEFTHKNQQLSGHAEKIGNEGELIVRLANGEKIKLFSGEISLTKISS